MQTLDFEAAIQEIVAADGRYQPDAYTFVQEGIRHTQKMLGRDKQSQKHVGGKELLRGMRDYGLSLYGPMTATVLEEWGIRTCEDFGEIVFNLIKYNQATRSETDSRDDFKHGYDFDEAFRQPFRPTSRRPIEQTPAPAKMISQN